MMILSTILALVPGLVVGPFALVRANGSGENVLIQGSPLHGSNGLCFDDQDRLYVASLWGNEIVILDPDSGAVLDRLGMDDGIYSPLEVIIGPDGSIYWTAMLSGYVGRMAPDGTATTQYVGRGTNGIAISDDGRLFVSLAFLGDGLYELDLELQDPPKLIHGPMGMLLSFAFGPDGYIYGMPLFTGELVRVDVNTDPATVETVLAVGGGVRFDSQGRLHFKGEEGVTRLDLDTMEMEVLCPYPARGMERMAFDSQGRLFASHGNDGTIFQLLPVEDSRIVAQGGLIFPNGVCAMTIGGQERIIVADLWSIREFNAATGEMLQITEYMETGSMSPSALSLHADGDNLLISTWMGDYIYTFDPETDQVLEVFDDDTWSPVDAIRFMGQIVFTDYEDGCIKRADNTTIAEGFSMPSGLAAIGADLYVADWGTGEVWQVYDNGNLVKTRIATGLSKPEGLTDDIDGNLLVVETGAGRLSRVDTETGMVSLVADNLATGYPTSPGNPEHWMFSGVDVGPSGNIYVSGDVTDTIYCIKATKRVISTVDDLPEEVFRSGRHQRMFRKFIGVSQNLIDRGKYRSARAMMEFLRRRTDGTGNDWIVNPAAQDAMMDLLDMQISSLTEQIEG